MTLAHKGYKNCLDSLKTGDDKFRTAGEAARRHFNGVCEASSGGKRFCTRHAKNWGSHDKRGPLDAQTLIEANKVKSITSTQKLIFISLTAYFRKCNLTSFAQNGHCRIIAALSRPGSRVPQTLRTLCST